ncbi:hypothetical protein [Rubrobacter aplysinae]|uniref:hypothetical protein n=1 Tax=Rubrobacter aplysinae TaxID=909625 RepID=UPI00064BDACF|nr:hypothetical protein [Rubrobacter aplysinae]
MPYQGLLDIRYGRPAKCRIRIYEHEADEPPGSPVVLITDLADNAGEDISAAAEIIVGTLLATLTEATDLSTSTPPAFINHYPEEITGTTDSYELVEFDDPAVAELMIEETAAGAPASGRRVVWSIEDARFVAADKKMVETLLASGM